MIDPLLLAQLTWIVFVLVWGWIRYKPNRKSRKTNVAVRSRTVTERFSMMISSIGLGYVPAYWVVSGLLFGQYDTSLLAGFNYSPNFILVVIGTAVLFLSLRLFRLTHKALGHMWSHSLDLREGHKLVTTGIYERVRHPMYSAFWLWAVGAAFLLPNWIAGLSGLIGFGTLFFLRIGQEEALLEAEFGDDYRDYVRRTKRIIPGIY